MRKRILIAAIALVSLAALVLLGVLAYTHVGLDLLAGQLGRLERFGIHIRGVSGTLAGPLRIEYFELDHPRVHIVSHDIAIDPQLRGLLLQTIQVGSLSARDTVVTLRRAPPPPGNRTPRFLPRLLRVDARGVDLSGVRYVHVNGTAVDARRVRGRVTITPRRLRVRGFQVDAERFDASGDLLLHASQPLGLAGQASGHVRTNRDAVLALSAQVEGTVDRLAIKAAMQQPDDVLADALLTRADEHWKIAGHVNAAAFALDPFLANPPLSLRNVSLDVQADPGGIRLAGNIGIPQLDSKDLTIDAAGRFSERVLHIASADMALGGTPAKVHASGTIAFDGAAPTLDLAARWRSLQWPLHQQAVVTSTEGEGRLRGPMPYDFSVNAQIDGPRLPHAQGSANGVLSKQEMRISAYELAALGGSLTGDATLRFAQPRAWTISTRAAGVNPMELHREFPGRLNVLAHASGTGLNKDANFTIGVDRLSGSLRHQPVRGRGIVRRAGRTWRVADASIGLGDARLRLDATLRDTIDARWSLHAPSLQGLLPASGGTLEFEGSASGPRASPHLVADIHGSRLRYRSWTVGELNVDADVDASGANPSRLTLLAQRIGGGGRPLIDTWRMSGEGSAGDHHIAVDITGTAAGPQQASPHAQMQIAGRYDQKAWNATITTTQLSTSDPGRKITITEPATLMASSERAALDDLCLVVGAGRLCANGRWERNGPWEATVAGYEIPLAVVLPPAGTAAEYAGRIEGRVHAFGQPGQPWQGEAGMRIIDAAVIYRPQGADAETLNFGTGGLAATATPERIDFSFGVQAFTDTFLYANAHLRRDGSHELMNLPLTGNLRARAADASILPLVFPEIDHAAGLLTANANITGTLALPQIDGRVELANGEFDSYRVNLALRQLNLVADLASNGLDFHGSGRAGDGMLDVGGKLSWHEGQSTGTLRLRGENLLVADLPEYRVVASPDLTFSIDGSRIDARGDVTIPSARIQPAQLSGAIKASEDARYVGEHPSERAGRFKVHSEIRIRMGDDVRVDAFGLQGRIKGGVATTLQTGETPLGRGELAVEEGRYEAYGQQLDINRGRLLFEASPLDDPALDIEARRTVQAVTVGLNVRGTLRDPRLTFFSDPSMPQTQIVSYLLTGKSMDSALASDSLTTSSTRNALAFRGGALLASGLGRKLGLEEVGVESSVDSAGESNTSLVLGKFLSPRLFISYGISLTESINTLKLRYTISDRWVLKTEAGENQSADLEYTIER